MGRPSWNPTPPLNPKLADELSHDLGHARDLALDLLRTLDSGLDRARARSVAREIERGLQRSLHIDLDIDPALDHAHDIARDIVEALDHNLGLALVLARGRVLVRAVRGADTLVRTMAKDPSLGAYVAIYLALTRISQRRRTALTAKRVAPSASRLLAATAMLLPAVDRDRYARDFQSELWEIAHAGAGRHKQLAHAFRVAISAGHLHAELRSPRRRKTAP